MRFTRLVIEAGHSTVSLALHPRLTVIAGVDERVRTGLIRELIGALGSPRDGVHLEIEEDDGRRIAIFRPSNGADRVIDISSGTDVSSEFTSRSGAIDVLGAHGLDVLSATGAMYVDRDGLTASSPAVADAVARLANQDQTELWSGAARVRLTAGQLEAMEDEQQHSSAEHEVEARIDALHQDLEHATNQQSRLRRATVAIAVLAFIVAVPVSLTDPVLAIPALAIGLLTLIGAFAYRGHVANVRRREQQALADAGAESYLGFVVQRVDGMLSGKEDLKQAAAAKEDHRLALITWSKLAGDMTVEWAFEHHDEIAASARLERELSRTISRARTSAKITEEVTETVRIILDRALRLEQVASSKQALPLILDDPLSGLDAEARLAVVDLLADLENVPQVLLLTEQDDVADWARDRASSGKLAIVEPQTRPAGAVAV